MSRTSHLINRQGRFYYFVRVPSDLHHFFNSSFIKKSLKTNNKIVAREEAIALEHKIFKSFRLIRSGLLSDDQVSTIVTELLPKRNGNGKGSKDGLRLSELMEAYTNEHESRWGSKTKMENLGTYKLIKDVMGDVELKNFSKKTIVDLREKLGRLPANVYKLHPDKTVKQVLNMQGIVPMSTMSLNKHVSRLSSLMKFAIKEGYISVNYAERMKIPVRRRADEERKVYTQDEIQKIVKHLPRDPRKPERYWIPLIAMYSGLRLDEICQLYIEDVQQVDDICCFSINDEKDKKLKTLSSRRVVPVHPKLLDLGLLEYVEALKRSESPRLWMNLNRRDADGYGNAFGKWFQRFNRTYITTDKGKVFHSLRHVVADTLKQSGIQEIIISEILGHANDSLTMSRYGKRYQPKVLLEAMQFLDYGIQF
jgi:integrase